MTIIPDASVIVPLLINEENSLTCEQVIRQATRRIHLDFTLIEVANTLRNGVARGRISHERSMAAFEEMTMICDNPIQASNFLQAAVKLALEINHSVYDCLYAVAARENKAILVTCDAKFAAKLDPAIYSVQVM